VARRLAISPYAASRGSWAGAYMTSPDGRPLVGGAGHIANLFLACGDNGTSFKIAPAIGLGLAQLMLNKQSQVAGFASLSPARFGAQSLAD
jgi:sarcosine oxidase, subunit beta